jgi:monolysocardiolipin acyltransferase
MPRVVPLWIDGPQNVMDESRTFPRFLPRPGKDIKIVFGHEVDTESAFGDLRRKWTDLKKKEEESSGNPARLEIGILTENLMYSKEAAELRIECTKRVREEVLKVRRSTGLPDEDPKAGLVETWKAEGEKREGRMKDGSWVKDA